MIVADVNALVYAFRPETPLHQLARRALTDCRDTGTLIVLPDVAASFIRIVTDKRLSKSPDKNDDALEFIDVLTGNGRFLREARATRWTSFRHLIELSDVSGPLVPDALIAATALDLNASILTADKDFLQFQGLRVQLMTPIGIVDHTVK